MAAAKGLGDAIYAKLRRKIIECEILPGAAVTQGSLTDLVGSNLGALRAALTRLVQEGLLRSVPRHGYIVSGLSVKDAEDIMQVRIVLESHAAFLAAGKIAPATLAAVRSGFAPNAKTAEPPTISAWIANNKYFKRTMAEATGNAWLVKDICDLVDHYERYVRLSHQKIDRRREMAEGAEALLEALKAGDGPLARTLTERHLVQTREIVVQVLLSSAELKTLELTMSVERGPKPRTLKSAGA